MSSTLDSQFLMKAQTAMMSGNKDLNTGNIKSMSQAREVAQDFEAVFLGQMLQPLFKNLGAEKPFGGGASEAMWRSMQVDEYGKAIAKAGGIGIADAVFQEILKMQEVH